MNLSYISLIFILSSFLACSKANFVGEVSKQKNPAGTPPAAGDMPGEDALGETPGQVDDGSEDGGNTDSGNTDGGNTDSGNTDSGNTDSGNTDSGNTDSGNTDSGNTDSGNTDSGNTDSGNTDSGNTDSGNTDSGNTDDGSVDGGSTDSGNTDDGSVDGGSTDSGNTDDGSVDGGSTDSGNTDGGNTDGGNADGGNADGSNPHECKDPKEEIIDICERYELLSLEQELFYPERMDCSFKPKRHHRHHYHSDTLDDLTEGNLHRKDRYLQAREWQTRQVELPENAVICGMEIVSKQDQIQYDDFLIFTIDDRILMLSNNELLRKMPKKDGVYHWDFDAIKGRKYGFDGDRYCLGNDSSCIFPGHDKQGSVNFSVGTSAIAAVSASLQGQTTYNFSAIATGDNDDEDCWHTDLELDVKIRYVLKP